MQQTWTKIMRLEDLSPVWLNILKRWHILNRYEREALTADLKSFNKCIIAEVYGWTNCYMRFSANITHNASGPLLLFLLLSMGPILRSMRNCYDRTIMISVNIGLKII